jgi:hypothetical protein
MNLPVTTLRICKICNFVGEHNELAKSKSKASGWMGNVCWACHIASKTEPNRRARKRSKLLQEIWK